MKRGYLSMAMGLILVGTVGCVAATVKNNRFGTDREVVAVNGQVYVVDKADGAVMKLDLAQAGPFVPIPECD